MNAQGSGPEWIRVRSKDGTISEYGATTGSRFMDESGQHVWMWRLSRVTDPNGNYIDYIYDTQNGTPTRYSYLAEVRYTGNSVLMMQPYYTIRFNYDLREDKNTIYDGGAAMTLNSLIESIEIEGDNGAIWKYNMTYGYDNKHCY